MVVDIDILFVVVFKRDDLIALHHVKEIEAIDLSLKAVDLWFHFCQVEGKVAEKKVKDCSN